MARETAISNVIMIFPNNKYSNIRRSEAKRAQNHISGDLWRLAEAQAASPRVYSLAQYLQVL